MLWYDGSALDARVVGHSLGEECVLNIQVSFDPRLQKDSETFVQWRHASGIYGFRFDSVKLSRGSWTSSDLPGLAYPVSFASCNKADEFLNALLALAKTLSGHVTESPRSVDTLSGSPWRSSNAFITYSPCSAASETADRAKAGSRAIQFVRAVVVHPYEVAFQNRRSCGANFMARWFLSVVAGRWWVPLCDMVLLVVSKGACCALLASVSLAENSHWMLGYVQWRAVAPCKETGFGDHERFVLRASRWGSTVGSHAPRWWLLVRVL